MHPGKAIKLLTKRDNHSHSQAIITKTLCSYAVCQQKKKMMSHLWHPCPLVSTCPLNIIYRSGQRFIWYKSHDYLGLLMISSNCFIQGGMMLQHSSLMTFTKLSAQF